MRSIFVAASLLLLSASVAMGEDARLILRSEPAGLDAWAGGRYLGRTPLERPLPAGEIRLLLAYPGDSLYHPPAADTTVVLEDGTIHEVDLAIGRAVTVRSIPYGLAVYQGDRRLGLTPFQWMLIPDQREGLRLETPFGPVPIPGDSLLLSGSWEWRTRGDIFGVRPARSSGGWRKIGRTLMPGAAVAFAAAGIMVERSADSAYDRYRRTGDPDAIRRHYDDATARDRWAAALWVGAEASIAAAILAWLLPDGEEPSEEWSRR